MRRWHIQRKPGCQCGQLKVWNIKHFPASQTQQVQTTIGRRTHSTGPARFLQKSHTKGQVIPNYEIFSHELPKVP